MVYRFLKRTLDILLSLFAVVILSPVFVFIAVLIKLSSPGPVFFRQTRVGKGGREFRLIKFRTMRVDAEHLGPQVTAGGDCRITGFGMLLRKTKLDELPELGNVLAGDLSLVGPRPEVPRYVRHYKPEWGLVFRVRPGITDLATLQFRDEESVLAGAQDRERAYIDIVLPTKMKLALDYVDRQSLWLDLKILFLTVWGITLGRFFARPSEEIASAATEMVKSHKTNSAD